MKKSITILGVCLPIFLTSCVSMKQYNVVKENNRVLIAALDKASKDYSALENANKTLVVEKANITSAYEQLKQQYDDLVKKNAGNNLTEEWLGQVYHCPIELIGHGDFPHRVLKKHE